MSENISLPVRVLPFIRQRGICLSVSVVPEFPGFIPVCAFSLTKDGRSRKGQQGLIFVSVTDQQKKIFYKLPNQKKTQILYTQYSKKKL